MGRSWSGCRGDFCRSPASVRSMRGPQLPRLAEYVDQNYPSKQELRESKGPPLGFTTPVPADLPKGMCGAGDWCHCVSGRPGGGKPVHRSREYGGSTGRRTSTFNAGPSSQKVPIPGWASPWTISAGKTPLSPPSKPHFHKEIGLALITYRCY